MKTLILPFLILVAIPVCAQQPTSPSLDSKKLNWLESRFRQANLERAAAAEKKAETMQERLKIMVAAPSYPDQQRDIFLTKTDLAILQKELEQARDELAKGDDLLVKALADKHVRKVFNKELQARLALENQQTAAENSAYRSRSLSGSSTYSIKCYSGGFGRYFWVRCTSSWY